MGAIHSRPLRITLAYDDPPCHHSDTSPSSHPDTQPSASSNTSTCRCNCCEYVTILPPAPYPPPPLIAPGTCYTAISLPHGATIVHQPHAPAEKREKYLCVKMEGHPSRWLTDEHGRTLKASHTGWVWLHEIGKYVWIEGGKIHMSDGEKKVWELPN